MLQTFFFNYVCSMLPTYAYIVKVVAMYLSITGWLKNVLHPKKYLLYDRK